MTSYFQLNLNYLFLRYSGLLRAPRPGRARRLLHGLRRPGRRRAVLLRPGGDAGGSGRGGHLPVPVQRGQHQRHRRSGGADTRAAVLRAHAAAGVGHGHAQEGQQEQVGLQDLRVGASGALSLAGDAHSVGKLPAVIKRTKPDWCLYFLNSRVSI